METSCLLLLFGVMTSLMSVITVKGEGLPVEGSDFFDKLNCSENENICDEDKHQVCDTSTKKCRCETETLWKKISDKCVKQEELFQKCGSKVADPEVHCVVPGSKCILTDFSEPRMSCMCNTPDYVDIPNPGGTPVSEVYKDICGKVLPQGGENSDNNCDCNLEAGKCYGLPNNGDSFNSMMDGCRCDISFSGPKCEKKHVDVDCNITNKKMDVCYLPHDDVDTSQPVKMFVTDKYDEENCRGNNVTEEGGTCAKGRYLLSVDLPTGTDSENKCGTLRTQKDQMKRFENTIQVELGGNSKASHTFTVYCEWESNTFRSAGVLVASKPQNNRGESLFADVSMLVLDSTNKPFGENPRIHTKDKIKFLVMVKVDDTYGALLPTYCTASPSGSMYSPKGDNLNQQLLMDSCPVTSLPTNNQMRFRRKNGKAYEMITDEMNLIKLKVGTTVYIHCKVKLCLRGTEDLCSMPNCTTNTRRKREAENEGYLEEDATVKLTLIDDNNSYTSGMSTITMTTMGFSVVISLLVALVMIIVSVLIVLVMRLRARGNKVNDTIQLADKPQRFSLPRINRNHLRI